CDEDLRADAVRAQGERVRPEVDKSREVADLRERLTEAFPAVAQRRDEGGDVGRLLLLADPGLGVGPDHAAWKRPRLFQGSAEPLVNMLSVGARPRPGRGRG